MKKFIRVFLFIELFFFAILIIKDLEALTTVNPLFGQSRTMEEWRWFWVADVVPLAALGLATFYTFRHCRKNNYMLAISLVMYCLFLFVSESIEVHTRFVCAPQVVIAVTTVMYLLCVFLPKIPYRQKVAAGVMTALALSMIVVYLVNEGGFANIIDWGITCVPPVIAFAMLGNVLPEK